MRVILLQPVLFPIFKKKSPRWWLYCNRKVRMSQAFPNKNLQWSLNVTRKLGMDLVLALKLPFKLLSLLTQYFASFIPFQLFQLFILFQLLFHAFSTLIYWFIPRSNFKMFHIFYTLGVLCVHLAFTSEFKSLFSW